MSILDRVSPVTERTPYLKCLFYGMPGVGKTKLSASAPGALVVDAEHGTRTLMNHPELGNVKVLSVKSFDDVMALFWELQEGKLEDVQTVVIDSISELQKRQMDDLLRENAVKDKNRSPYLPFMQDYKLNTEVLRRLIVSFRDLERNLIVTAHAVEDKDESDGRVFWRPAVTPKFAETLLGIMDVVGFMSLDVDREGKQTRTLQIMPSRRVVAKTRIGGLPPVLTNPTFDDLLAAANNTAKEIES